MEAEKMKTHTSTKTTKTAKPATKPATYPQLRVSDAASQHLRVELCPPGQINPTSAIRSRKRLFSGVFVAQVIDAQHAGFQKCV
jgi:hypothetical protein